MQNELNILNLQIKEKDQEYRLNELKIRELRRQLPAKVLKPLEVPVNQQGASAAAKNRQSSVGAPSKSAAALEPMNSAEMSGRRGLHGGVAASHN